MPKGHTIDEHRLITPCEILGPHPNATQFATNRDDAREQWLRVCCLGGMHPGLCIPHGDIATMPDKAIKACKLTPPLVEQIAEALRRQHGQRDGPAIAAAFEARAKPLTKPMTKKVSNALLPLPPPPPLSMRIRYLKVLGLDANATPELIKRAYRTEMLAKHPDRCNKEQRDEATARAQEINEAYNELNHAGNMPLDEIDVLERNAGNIHLMLNEIMAGDAGNATEFGGHKYPFLDEIPSHDPYTKLLYAHCLQIMGTRIVFHFDSPDFHHPDGLKALLNLVRAFSTVRFDTTRRDAEGNFVAIGAPLTERDLRKVQKEDYKNGAWITIILQYMGDDAKDDKSMASHSCWQGLCMLAGVDHVDTTLFDPWIEGYRSAVARGVSTQPMEGELPTSYRQRGKRKQWMVYERTMRQKMATFPEWAPPPDWEARLASPNPLRLF